MCTHRYPQVSRRGDLHVALKSKVTKPCVKSIHHVSSVPFPSDRACKNGRIKLAPRLITFSLSLVLFVGVINAGGGDKDQKNESDKKPEAHLDLAVC